MSGRFPIRALLFSVAALALGGGTLLLSQGRADGRSEQAVAAAPAFAMSKILVATRSMVPGTVIKPGDVVWRDWPIVALDPAYIKRSSAASHGDFAGSIVRVAVEPGEPMTSGRFVAAGSRGVLAAVTRPGSRAMSISVTPTSGVSGLIVPGDRVDVVLTYALPRPADGAGGGIDRRAATTILSDLRVLAVDQRLAAAPADGKDIRNASLEVTAKQSEILALAADLGKLSLSLRSLERAAVEPTADSVSGTLDYQVARYLPGLGAAPAPRRAAARRVEAVSLPAEFHGGKPNGAVATQ